jgi:glycosyltransferase involved in cell wall biosynthesis
MQALDTSPKPIYYVDISVRKSTEMNAISPLSPERNPHTGGLASVFSRSPERKNIPHEVIVEREQRTATPVVTVIISLYNYRQHIVDCLESVKLQTINELDLIVVDDRSTDDSAEIAHKWLVENGDRFTKYLLIRHKVNSGPGATRNTAFARSRTKYVFVLDADNLLYPRCLERLISALDNCDASFAYSYIEKFGETSSLLNTRPWNPGTLQRGNTIDAMVLMRKRVWEKVGGYSTNEVMRLGWEDYELWFKIARINGWGILVPEILGRYRVHHDSLLHTSTNPNAQKLWGYLRSNYPEFFPEP